MSLAQLILLLMFAMPITAGAAGREEDISHLKRVISDEGMPEHGANPRDINRRLASMSDHDLRSLAQQHAEMGYSGDPLTVVLSSIVLLILVVLVIVAIVE